MGLGDVYEATAGDSTDLYYVDVEMFGVTEYGSVYILDAERPALIDTGIGKHPDVILDAMSEVGIAPADLAVIAPTHAHLDHAGGAGYLARECPNAEVCLPEAAARFLVDPERLWAGTEAVVGDMFEYYGEPEPIPEDRITRLADGDTVDLGDHALDVHDAPGHAFHQSVFYDPANDGVFVADAAGIYTPGIDRPYPATAPPDFDLDGCLADVEMLRDLDPSALYYYHFGDAERDELLAEYATVLEEWVADVRAARERLDDDDAVVEYFLEHDDTGAVDAWGQAKARQECGMNVRGVLGYLDEP
jgi:glyoxylase-like metal-dependent hydrolase (beta-lactamase superfamily II)